MKKKKNPGGRPPITKGERTVVVSFSIPADEVGRFLMWQKFFGLKTKSRLFRMMFEMCERSWRESRQQ